jgi:hypothetical protein
MNRGLLFAGPPPPPFGDCGKISEIHKAAVLATLYIWGRRRAAVSYDVISLAANLLLKALCGTDVFLRSARPPVPVGASFLR